MKLRSNPIFPNALPALSRELGVLWRELATFVNSNISTTITTDGKTRNRNGVDTTDDVVIDDSDAGLVLKSPDGDYWRIQIDNAGSFVITNLGATKP
jgi:hypothetical protein